MYQILLRVAQIELADRSNVINSVFMVADALKYNTKLYLVSVPTPKKLDNRIVAPTSTGL